MVQHGIDAATPQAGLSFRAVRAAGYTSAYIKLGGDNVGRYIAPHYAAEVDAARAAGLRVGHYWVPNMIADPGRAAAYFAANLRHFNKATDFLVLDNESLDGASMYTDAQAARWVQELRTLLGVTGFQTMVYLGLSNARSQSWRYTVAQKPGIIIAAYGYKPFTYDLLGRIPVALNVGHQTGGAIIGGVNTDVDVWKDTAFIWGTTPPAPVIPPVIVKPPTVTPAPPTSPPTTTVPPVPVPVTVTPRKEPPMQTILHATSASKDNTIKAAFDYLYDIESGQVGWIRTEGEASLITKSGVPTIDVDGETIDLLSKRNGVIPTRKLG